MSAHLARAALAPLVALVLAGCSAPQALAPEPTTKATRPLPRADAPSAPRASGEPLDYRTALAAFEIVTSLRCTFGESSRFDFEGHERSTSSEEGAKVSFLAVRSSHLALPPGTGSNRSALERRPLASQLTGSCVPLGVR